ncbi:MAG: hypothetical protein A3G25_06565 [Betaproteobacteria bacterium RIFCSPLOWO2_12_FULL_63_13]|nr:MAG: hypothetical protein A3H32_01185 [Betaproteobacteria bacterium RIFCSPLOWO2_02_FULL_63_19]OGA44482.1 MAG: hypothetical protein A3G25_06565 [Betaproteobacteria bacterium RIFCSPLOWO2_12_FULL_63_13]
MTAIVLAFPASAWADVYAYVALPLTATQETSVPSSSGYGSVTALYDTATKTLVYSIVYQLNPEATATAAHFHGPAALGSNAGVAIGLPTQPTGNAGKLTGSVTLTAAQEAELLAGNWYVNIHSSLSSGGELRAQLLENSGTLALPLYNNGKLTLQTVLTPGLAGTASYSAELSFSEASNAFNLTGATPFR